MLDAQQLETAGFGSKTALWRFPFESPEGNFADEARNFSCRICSMDKPRLRLHFLYVSSKIDYNPTGMTAV